MASHPAEYDVLRTPRGGLSLTCRVAVLLPGRRRAARRLAASPRSDRRRRVAAWLAGMLPARSRVRLRGADARGVVTETALPAAAASGPVDLVLDQPEVIRTRIRAALPAGIDPGARPRDPAWTTATVGLDELLTVAADLREVLACSARCAAAT